MAIFPLLLCVSHQMTAPFRRGFFHAGIKNPLKGKPDKGYIQLAYGVRAPWFEIGTARGRGENLSPSGQVRRIIFYLDQQSTPIWYQTAQHRPIASGALGFVIGNEQTANKSTPPSADRGTDPERINIVDNSGVIVGCSKLSVDNPVTVLPNDGGLFMSGDNS